MVQTLVLWMRSIFWLSGQEGRVSACGFSTLRLRNKSYLCIRMSLPRADLLLYLKISHSLTDLV
jgi:hypothetical protein